MSSEYPILDNRPIDKWRVTELKEELKRRKLPIKGLKEDLVKRLDEALRVEKETVVEETDNRVNDPEPGIAQKVAETEGTVVSEPGIGNAGSAVEIVGVDNSDISEFKAVSNPVDIKDPQETVDEPKESELVSDQPMAVEITSTDVVPSAGFGDQVCESLSSEPAMGGQGWQDDKLERDIEESMAQQHSKDLKTPHEDVKLNTFDPNDQVSEVNTNLGFSITSNSVSSDSVSRYGKNELKGNIIADNVKLELDVKHEMVQPLSSDLVDDFGKSHPEGVEEPLEKERAVGETENNITNADTSRKNISAELGSSEKLNIDRSSGDESMEEDAPESKQIDSNDNSVEVGLRTEKSEVTALKEEPPLTAMDSDLPAEEKGTASEDKDVLAASTDKRKLLDQVNSEPSKRQRRWKSEGSHTRESPISNVPPSVAATDVPQPPVLRRNLSQSDSGVAEDTPKEREVPPSTKAASNSLRIDNFLRPFTLKAVQELLAKTGTVTSFWMDHIKTHCYVTYSSVEEAVATRNAVYNLQWPPNGGRHLVADFVDPEEVKLRVDFPPPVAPASEPELPQPSPRQRDLRQVLSRENAPPPPPPSLSNTAPARVRAHPPPPPPKEKVEAPIMTLDDLFRKTKTTPRIYYLPLSEEQVSVKLEARQRNSRQP